MVKQIKCIDPEKCKHKFDSECGFVIRSLRTDGEKKVKVYSVKVTFTEVLKRMWSVCWVCRVQSIGQEAHCKYKFLKIISLTPSKGSGFTNGLIKWKLSLCTRLHAPAEHKRQPEKLELKHVHFRYSAKSSRLIHHQPNKAQRPPSINQRLPSW